MYRRHVCFIRGTPLYSRLVEGKYFTHTHTNDNFCPNAFMILIVKTIVALAMLVRRFNFQMAVGAPPVSLLLCRDILVILGFGPY